MISSQLSLLRMSTGSPSRVVTAMTRLKHHLFRYQGHVSAALVLGGVDCTGAHLYTVWPHGSTDKLPYVTMGSGSLAAMAVFEEGPRHCSSPPPPCTPPARPIVSPPPACRRPCRLGRSAPSLPAAGS